MKELINEMKEIRQKNQEKEYIQPFFWEIFKCFDDTFDPAEELKQQDTEDLL